MKLLEELRNLGKGFEVLVALTYNADLPWFESMLLGRLQAQGVRRILLLADERPLSNLLWTQRELIRQAGQSYVVEGLRTRISFHPKLLLLTGERCARLYVGSGNLSRGGLDRNREFFERWDVEPEETLLPAPFGQVRDLLEVLRTEHFPNGSLPEHAADILHAALGAGIFSRPLDATPEVSLRLVTPRQPLFPALHKPPSPAKRLRMSAPYFDPDGAQVVELAHHFQAAAFTVVTDPRMTNLTPEGAAAIQDAGGRLEWVDAEEEPRRVHAKFLHAEGVNWQVALHGSANLSRAAWRGSNVELVVERTGSSAGELAQILDRLPTREPSEDELSQLTPRDLEEDGAPEREPRPLGPRIVSAHWRGDRVALEVERREEAPTRAEFLQSEGVRDAEEVATRGGALSATPPASVRQDRPLMVRLVGTQGAGPWCVVHDRRELHEQARGRSVHEQELLGHLAADPMDLQAAEELLEFYVQVMQAREQEILMTRQGQPEEKPARSRADPDEPRHVPVREEDFQAKVPPPSGVGGGRSSALLDSPRLLMQLLLGGVPQEDVDASEGESGLEEEEKRLSTSGSSPAAAHKGAQRPELSEVTAKARDVYLRILRGTGSEKRGAVRLLEDTLVLCAAFQRALRSGGISTFTFAAEQVCILRTFLGRASAPFPRALGAVPEAQREELWTRAPLLPGAALLLYNVCIADLALGRDHGGDPTFPNAAPVLWLRHVVRHAPPLSIDKLLTLARQQTPRLKRHGALWLGDALPSASAKADFNDFLERTVRQALALERLDEQLRATRTTLRRVPRMTEEDDEVLVVTPGEDSTLAVGFAQPPDRDVKGGARLHPLVPRTCLVEGAFLAAPGSNRASREGGLVVRQPMREVSTQELFSFETVRDHLGSSSPEILEALEALQRIIDS